MNQQFLAGGLVVLLALLAYFSIAIPLTGEAYILVGVLLFVLVVQFLIYKPRYKSLGNLELVKRMYAAFTGTIERIKERVAEDQTPRRAEASRRRKALLNRESRRVNTPKVVPVDKKYTDSIERRVREARAKKDQSEGGTNETES